MIKKNTKETLNKFNFQQRKNQESLLVLIKRYQTFENTTNKWLRMIAMKNLDGIWFIEGET